VVCLVSGAGFLHCGLVILLTKLYARKLTMRFSGKSPESQWTISSTYRLLEHVKEIKCWKRTGQNVSVAQKRLDLMKTIVFAENRTITQTKT